MNLGLGLRLRSVLSSGGAAPSGIPTATTTIINVNSTQLGIDIDFYKVVESTWYDAAVEKEFRFFNSQWELYDQGNIPIFNTLPNQTENSIPLTGWSPADTTITVVA